MKITCPNCDVTHDLGPEAYGRKVQCPCGQRFFIEAPTSEAPKFSSEAADSAPEPDSVVAAVYEDSAETRSNRASTRREFPVVQEAELKETTRCVRNRPANAGKKKVFRRGDNRTTTAVAAPIEETPKRRSKIPMVVAVVALASITGLVAFRKGPLSKMSFATS